MSRNTEYKFIDTSADAITAYLVAAYERFTGTTVHPASPEKLFIQWIANIVMQERAQQNYVANQNIPSRAEGENLDALGELFYATERPAAQAAVTTERFHISEAQQTAVLIPAGTRVTDIDNTLFWVTTEDAFVPIGATYVDVAIRCQTEGTVGNGYAIGQIGTIVDVYDYYSRCENLTVSDGGSDIATDDEYYELLRASMDAYSCAGSRGGYYYFARRVSTEIVDVVANQPTPGCVAIYALMADGTPASSAIKSAILDACSADDVRPLTDNVSVADPATVAYDISFTYYITKNTTRSAAEIAADVEAAVTNYKDWQCARFGRDINPDKLREYLLAVDGIKRVVLVDPSFTVLRDGLNDTVPQIASIGTTTITSGGYEDE